jgi:spore germination cell wall hydrolase CwlJ-like protein
MYLLLPIILLSVFVTTNAKTQENVDYKIQQLAKKLDPTQIRCLATNIFYEAGMEPIQGQAAVARVVINRVRHGFGPNPCKVMYQVDYFEKEREGQIAKVKVCQFSWVCERNRKLNENDPRYKQAMHIAYEVLALDKYKDVVPKNTLFFHATHVQPDWNYKQVKKIGNHVFYSKK